MESLFNTAPPLEPLQKHSSITNEIEPPTNNDPNNPSSRCSSISSSASHSNPSSSNNSVSLSASASFSNLSLASMQNIKLSNKLHQEHEKENNPVWNEDASSNTHNRRRSARISKKRKLGHMTFYTPKSWEAFYAPPKKKQKTNSKKQAAKRIKSKPITTKALRNTTNTANADTSKPKTATQLLSAQNKKMKAIQTKLEKKRTEWLQNHYSAFETFLSERVKHRLRPKSNASTSIYVTKDLKQQPEALQYGVLRDYQLLSVNWLRNLRNNGVPAILADEMGLGKTIQSIATIAAFLSDVSLHNNNKESPSLIICPLSVAEAWISEFSKWMPSLKCVLFHGPKLQRENLMKHKLVFGEFDVCVTTYEIATNNRGFLSKFMWNYFILDEAHRIKNEKTDWHNALKTIWSRCLYAVLLTGTPIQNNMHELWSLLSFMFGDDVFDEESADIFDSAYQQSTNTQNKELLSKTPYLLNPFFLRRLKSEVELSLPPKEEIIIKLEMSVEQRKYYKTFLAAHASLIDQVSDTLYNGDKHKAKKQLNAWKKLRALYMNLRKIALHPFLLETYENRVHVDNGKEMIAHSSKLQLLDKLLARLSSEGHRVLLFSCFTLVLDLLEIYCEYRGYKYLRLDGSTSRIRRKIDIMRFNDDPHSPFFMYLISNRAGGVGINLQSADTVIHFDTDWNPQADLQAQARAHRIGQKNMVKIYRLISKHTVEERILFRSQQKLYLDAVVNQGTKMLQDSSSCDQDAMKFDLNNDDLLGCIKFGAQAVFDNNAADEDEIDLDILLERSYNISDDKKDERKKLLKDLSNENNVRDFNFSKKLKSGNEFEGTTYEKKEFHYDDAADDHHCEKRRSSNKIQTKEMMIDGLRFKTRIEENSMSEFYKQCGEWIYDSRNTKPFHHEMIRCWGCDTKYTERELTHCDTKIIKCHQCTKTFHATRSCWQGERTRMGVYVCNQHQCFECALKTSECGMILRCIGCQMSFCYECCPDPHWKHEDSDGLHFVDECKVAQHHRYKLPQSTYMYIFCSNQCKTFYDTVYSNRILPDLSLKYDDLPEILLEGMRKIKCSRMRKERLNDIFVNKRIASYNMPNNVMDRLQFHLQGNCQLIGKLYEILYLFPIVDSMDGDGDEEKEDKDYILNQHFVGISTLNNALSDSLSFPQWKQCCKCKEWRVIPIKLNHVQNGEWMNEARYISWKCCKQDGFEQLCDTKQVVPSEESHSEIELSALQLQRQLLGVNYEMKLNANQKKQNQCLELKRVQKSMDQIIEEFKIERVKTLQLNEEHLAQARFVGIGEWNGFINEKNQKDENKICKIYQHLLSSFREWRIQSLKTVMDLIGFFVESRKKQRGSKLFRVDTIALSYNKDKVISALALFLMYPNRDFLELTTSFFSK